MLGLLVVVVAAGEHEVIVGDRRLTRIDRRCRRVIWLKVWIANGAVPSDAGSRSA